MPVRIEKDGHVTTVIMNRPAVRNAVDHATALELKAAFLAFEVDVDAYVGVLCGDRGSHWRRTLCRRCRPSGVV